LVAKHLGQLIAELAVLVGPLQYVVLQSFIGHGIQS
jgi:hypothetical protein